MKPPRQKIRAFLLLYYRRLLSLEKMHVELMKRARTKEVTGLLHISDRLHAGELSRVEAARETLYPLAG